MKAITKEIEEILKRPLPAEAVSQHPTKTYLSSIKAIYVTERLNEAFGIGAWRLKVEKEYLQEFTETKKNPMVVVKTIFEVPEYNIYYESYGGNDNQDLGDAYKGATTDGITKIGSYLGIGIDVFKGKSTGKGLPKTTKKEYQEKNKADYENGIDPLVEINYEEI